MRLVILTCLLIYIIQPAANAQSPGTAAIDSARQIAAQPATDSAFIATAFFIADTFMDTDQYDSAQYWLNKIHEKLPLRKPSVFNYFFSTRQAEVYYYNNLQQMGLQEAKRSLSIAQALHDSLLLADSYNFLGLFYMNLDSARQSVPFYKEGMRFCRQPPYPREYISLTKPHHLYGNLAEAFDKMGQLDSALFYYKLSLQKATDIQWGRGIAVAGVGLGIAFFKQHQYDSAMHYYLQAQATARASRDFDVELLTYSGLAQCYQQKNRADKANQSLTEGFALLDKEKQLNDYFALQFLQTAIEVYHIAGETGMEATALSRMTAIQKTNLSRNNRQMQTILMAGLSNETRLLNMEVTDAKRKQQLAVNRFYVVGLLVLLLAGVFFMFWYFSRQKLKLAHIRNKISQDLHDEVGATLSGLALYSHLAREQLNRQQQDDAGRSLTIMQQSATQMVGKLNDIVWAVNPLHDSLSGLMQRLEEYAMEMATVKNITVEVTTDTSIQKVKLPMDDRKNIYLLCKEAINNAVKYSEAKRIHINARLQQYRLIITVADDGKGFDETVKRGNGLNNMKQRADEMDAGLEVISANDKGTLIRVTAKIP